MHGKCTSKPRETQPCSSRPSLLFEVGGRVTTRTWDQPRLIKHTANPSVAPSSYRNWGHASAWLKLKAASLSRFPQGMQQVAALTEEKATFPYSVRLSPYTPVERAAGATCSPATLTVGLLFLKRDSDLCTLVHYDGSTVRDTLSGLQQR